MLILKHFFQPIFMMQPFIKVADQKVSLWHWICHSWVIFSLLVSVVHLRFRYFGISLHHNFHRHFTFWTKFWDQVQVSQTHIFWTAVDSCKKQIWLCIAQDLVWVSLTKSFLELSTAVNLLLSNPTLPNLTALIVLKNLFVSETGIEKPIFGWLEFRPTLVNFVSTKKMSMKVGWHG